MPARGRPDQRGSAVVDFVLGVVVLVPLFLGLLQVALVLHVRNTLTSAASEGARYAATADEPLTAGVARTREQIAGALAARFARDVTARPAEVLG
ncbi:MAG: TadE/TadG family type IV pilus assembly protein, partial [Nocardioidaceae bacterium]